MRPLRSEVSKDSLIMMGVPKKFCNKTILDFENFSPKNQLPNTLATLIKSQSLGLIAFMVKLF